MARIFSKSGETLIIPHEKRRIKVILRTPSTPKRATLTIESGIVDKADDK